MIHGSAILLLISSSSATSIVFLAVNIVPLGMFTLLVRQVFLPANRERYLQDSFIPFEDDSDEEKQLFGRPPHQGRRRDA